MQFFDKLSTRSPTLFKWGKLLSVTGSAQLLIQGAGFLSGIIVIRLLPTEEYAYYTLANTMLGTMAVLADGGISTGVMSEGGKKWQSRKELGKILATGMHMRRQFAVGSLAVSVPILYYLLHEQGLIWWQSILLILSLIPVFWAQLSGSLLQIIPKLHQDINDLLKINVQINVLRLLLTLPIVLLFPLAATAILSSGGGQIYGNLKLRDLSLTKADWQTEPSEHYRTKLLKTVRRILPGSIYYCISGQITVWLIAFFSTTESIAQIGALSRLVMLLTLVNLMVEMLIVPRYARLVADRQMIMLRLFQVIGLLIGLSGVIVLAVWLFPEVFLWILGSKYQDLQYEVVLMAISGCLNLISGVSHQMATSRGLIPNPYLYIFTTILSQILILYFFVDYTTLSGVILFSIYSALAQILYRLGDFVYRTQIIDQQNIDEPDPV